MTRPGKRAAIATVLAVAGTSLWVLNDRPVSPAPSNTIPTRRSQPNPAGERSAADQAARLRIGRDWEDLLEWLRAEPKPTAEEIRLRLTATRKAWAELDPQIRAEMITRLLESGDDAATGLDFRVGVHGLLAGWPTLRVFLLDLLAVSDPEMAAAAARKLLERTASPDEYATALRSLTRDGMGRATDGELLSYFERMLENVEWQSSRGFAEALDLARLVGTPDAARRLAAWNGSRALKSMAMDEFAARHPQAMFEVLETENAVDASARANLMARADPSQVAQLEAVDRYLRDSALAPDEAAVFLKSFPLRSATTGHRLYGELPAPYDFEQIRTGDRAAHEVASAWAADPALEQLRPQIEALKTRLAEWIEQSE
jgi:hypothetical protein